MNKAIKLVMTGLLVSANMLAQETDSIQQYGRGISVDWKESTRWCYYVCTWFGDYKQQKPADIG